MASEMHQGEGGKEESGATMTPSPQRYNPHKSVRVPEQIEQLMEWVATKRKRGEKVSTIHQECAILGAFFLAANQLPDADGTYADFSAEEIAHNILASTHTGVDFCERNGLRVNTIPQQVLTHIETTNKTLTQLLMQLSQLKAQQYEMLLNPRYASQSEQGSAYSSTGYTHDENTDELRIPRVSVEGSEAIANAFASGDETTTL